MKKSIQHDDEPRGNAVRARLDAINGIGQRTYTPTQVVVARAQGVRLWTADGRELIDFTSGVLVSNLGHHHALFEERYRHYCAELPRTSYNMVTEIEVEAAERLVRSMDLPGPRKVLWAASGSEGIQKAMWCALHKRPDCPIMLATRGGFHGKKGLAGDVTGESSPNPNVRFISFPMKDERPAAFYENELDTVARECGGRIALLITEPYLGAKGSWHPPVWYHELLARWCRAHGVALIFDEVQSCHGRTGNMFAYQTYGIGPDLVVLGKGLANGEPAAAVVGRADLIDALTYGEASDTFSGNPRACAAVCATFDVFERENVVENCRAMAKVIGEKLCRAMGRFAFIKDVRGEGLVYGVEMADDATAQRAVLEAYRGVEGKGVHFLGPLAGKVLRVSPPLIVTQNDLDEAFAI
ncbi:MAG: aspartate aminotransferase family protein, partial [Candidatus Hydrogenedentes bacterium]|nr:aspartate aminotransferase family protein [Candidatus Hydrogenedentota bacterium]